MRVAIVGSRNMTVENLEYYLPVGVTEIVSGGAKGVDACAQKYAEQKRLLFSEFRPDYSRYRRAAPLKRNEQIVKYADVVIAFWDGESKGTKYTIDYCQKCGKELKVIFL